MPAFALHADSHSDGSVLLAPAGDLDMASSPTLLAAAEHALADGASSLTVDLRRISFLDSTGLGSSEALDELVELHLVEPAGRDAAGQTRYRVHDLLADFARERCEAEDPPSVRTAAADRVQSAWLALAGRADRQLPHGTRYAEGLPLPEPPDDVAAVVDADPDAWFEAELPALAAVLDHACDQGAADPACRLALRLSGFLTLKAYDSERHRLFGRTVETCTSSR